MVINKETHREKHRERERRWKTSKPADTVECVVVVGGKKRMVAEAIKQVGVELKT